MNDTKAQDQERRMQAFLEKVMVGLTSYETSNEEIEKQGISPITGVPKSMEPDSPPLP